MSFTKNSVEFVVEGDTVRGTLYIPEGHGKTKIPGVVLGHGWGMVAGGDLEDYAQKMFEKGMLALTFDYRNLGKSDGLPRQHLDPQKQIEDFKAAISYLRKQPKADPERIGIWGSSYGGGHVLTVAATDPRVRCAVAQVPTISSWRAARARMSDQAWDAQWQAFTAERTAIFDGKEMTVQQTVGNQPDEVVSYPDPASFAYMTKEGERCLEWKNHTTLASLELARNYEPGAYIYRITDTPVLMVIAGSDTVTPHELQREAFDAMTCPKELFEVEGDHYTVYQEHFDATSAAAAGWFEKYLDTGCQGK